MKKRLSQIRAEYTGKAKKKPRRTTEQIHRDETRKLEAQKRLSNPDRVPTKQVEIEYTASSSGNVADSRVTIPALPWEL